MLDLKKNINEDKNKTLITNKILCWICHQKIINENKNIDLSVIFNPCLCKGSIGKVHKFCLNKYVLQEYNIMIEKFSGKIYLP